MRLFFNTKKIWIVVFIICILIILIIAGWLFLEYKFVPEDSVGKLSRNYEPYKSGPIIINGEMPAGPGEATLAPYLEIPSGKKFYVNVAQQDLWCSVEDCGIDGAIIQTLGGWVEVGDTNQSEVKAMFGLDILENQSIKSIVIIGDGNGKIVRIYPNKEYKDVLSILKRSHTDLASFDFLGGVSEFGELKVGDFSPLKPGDSIINLSSDQTKSIVEKIPKNKKFYLYGIHKKSYNEYVCFLGGCKYPYPDNAHDFLFAEVYEMGGWFLANDNENLNMAKLFGLKQEDVLSGRASLVVLTDTNGVIVAIHPQKTLNDTITILSQHPGLVDIKKTYNK